MTACMSNDNENDNRRVYFQINFPLKWEQDVQINNALQVYALPSMISGLVIYLHRDYYFQ